MKAKSILAALLLMAGLQTAVAQGFRVYKSDGTVVQFSLRTDSIVFYDGIGSDQDFGPFTPVNDVIVGKWYWAKEKYWEFKEDGTMVDYYWDLDFSEAFPPTEHNHTYKYFPYQGKLFVYGNYETIYHDEGDDGGYSEDVLVNNDIKEIYEVMLVDGELYVKNGDRYSKLGKMPPYVKVQDITLSVTTLTLDAGDTYDRILAIVKPWYADNTAVTWTSSNEGVARVDQGTVTAIEGGTCTITCRSVENSSIYAECQVTVVEPHEYVDLGLPSGTLWATCNIGANTPTQRGDLFAWGETTPKDSYTWSNYAYCNGSSNTLTKYCLDSNYGLDGFTDVWGELLSEDDAATVNWGSRWEIPTKEQFEELINKTDVTVGGGITFTSKTNGKSITLPPMPSNNSRGYYWTRSLNTDDSRYAWTYWYYTGTDNDKAHLSVYERSIGYAIRPVRK